MNVQEDEYYFFEKPITPGKVCDSHVQGFEAVCYAACCEANVYSQLNLFPVGMRLSFELCT